MAKALPAHYVAVRSIVQSTMQLPGAGYDALRRVNELLAIQSRPGPGPWRVMYDALLPIYLLAMQNGVASTDVWEDLIFRARTGSRIA